MDIRRKKIRVLFIVPHPLGIASDHRFQLEQYLEVVKSNNIEYAIRPFTSPHFYKILHKRGYLMEKFIYTILGFFYRVWNVIEAFNFDVVYIGREAFPFGPAFFEWLLARLGKPMIFDFDGSVLGYPNKTAKIMRLCKHVIIRNEALVEYAAKYNRNITVIPVPIEKECPIKTNAAEFLNVLKAVYCGRVVRKKDKIHILELITDLDIGGIPTLLGNLVGRFDSKKYKIIVCSLKKRSKDSVSEMIEKVGIRVVFLNAKKTQTFTAFYRLYLLIKDERIDIVHNWLFHSNVLGTLAGKIAKVPHIISSTFAIDLKKGFLRIMLDRMASRASDSVLVNAEAVKDVLTKREKVPPSKIVVIYTGIDLGHFKRKSHGVHEGLEEMIKKDDGPIIISVARLHAVKGHIYLLKAMLRILKEKPGAKLVLVGNGPMEKRLKARAQDLGIENSVVFLGVEPNINIPQVLMRSDIFALPSIEEGFPCSILEAMGMEVPSVVTNVGGVREIVKDGETGFIAQTCDPDDLSKVILKVANDPDHARKVARTARQRLEGSFDINVMVKKIGRLYDELDRAKNDTSI